MLRTMYCLVCYVYNTVYIFVLENLQIVYNHVVLGLNMFTIQSWTSLYQVLSLDGAAIISDHYLPGLFTAPPWH